MNGSLALFLLSLLAQSGIAPLGANLPGSQGTSDLDSSSGLTQYGWQINANNNELEYLIQISPDMLPFMTSSTNQKEFQSEIPKELVGRIRRVVVSIGTAILPRSPSLQEIQAMVPSIASLPGRMRDLEPGSQVTNVNNNQYPEPPANFGGTTGIAGNQNSNSTPVPSTPLGGAFLEQARSGNQQSNPSPGRPSLPANSQAPLGSSLDSGLNNSPSQTAANNRRGSLPSAPPPSRFSDTASSQFPTAGLPATQPAQSGQSGLGNTGWQASGNSFPLTNDNFDRGRVASNQPGTSPQWPTTTNDPNSLGYNQSAPGFNNFGGNSAMPYPAQSTSNQGYPQQPPNTAQQPSYDVQTGYGQNGYGQSGYGQNGYGGQAGYGGPHQQTSGYDRTGPSYPSTSGGFGDLAGTPGQSIADRTRGLDRWGNPVTTGPIGRPGETQLASRDRDYLAATDGRVSPSDASRTADQTRSTNLGRIDEQTASRQTTAPNEGNNYHLFVFFVLSVAVNLWMVHLLRSLYMRYRTLLTSLRGQTA